MRGWCDRACDRGDSLKTGMLPVAERQGNQKPWYFMPVCWLCLVKASERATCEKYYFFRRFCYRSHKAFGRAFARVRNSRTGEFSTVVASVTACWCRHRLPRLTVSLPARHACVRANARSGPSAAPTRRADQQNRPGRIRTYDQGIHLPRRFRRKWTISSPAQRSRRSGGVRDALACYQGRCSPQVVSAPSGGAPPAWLRIAMRASKRFACEGFPEFIPFTSRVTVRRHHFDESPALTAVLRARPREIVSTSADDASIGHLQ
jgi:hypothetical protein